jgi:hypothetical protein
MTDHTEKDSEGKTATSASDASVTHHERSDSEAQDVHMTDRTTDAESKSTQTLDVDPDEDVLEDYADMLKGKTVKVMVETFATRRTSNASATGRSNRVTKGKAKQRRRKSSAASNQSDDQGTTSGSGSWSRPVRTRKSTLPIVFQELTADQTDDAAHNCDEISRDMQGMDLDKQ